MTNDFTGCCIVSSKDRIRAGKTPKFPALVLKFTIGVACGSFFPFLGWLILIVRVTSFK